MLPQVLVSPSQMAQAMPPLAPLGVQPIAKKAILFVPGIGTRRTQRKIWLKPEKVVKFWIAEYFQNDPSQSQ